MKSPLKLNILAQVTKRGDDGVISEIKLTFAPNGGLYISLELSGFDAPDITRDFLLKEGDSFELKLGEKKHAPN
jgi:hypothetical protein